MRDFYKTILKELESLTGIRQMAFLEADPDGPQKAEIIIRGMVEQSKRFPYIPENEQQRIIREAMVTDQDYVALNSRVIYKWLNPHKDLYWGKATHQQPAEEDFKPATEEQVAYWVKEFHRMTFGNPVPKLTAEEILTEGKERKDPILKDLIAATKPELPQADPRQSKITEFVKTQGKGVNWIPALWFEIEGVRVPGDTQEEAQEIFVNALL